MEVTVTEDRESVIQRGRIQNALSERAKEVMFLKRILEDLGAVKGKVTIHEDNVGAMNIAENVVISKRTKHINARYRHHIQELIENGDIKVEHIL